MTMDFTFNLYRERRIGDKHLITTDHGSFSILDGEGYSRLKKGKIDGELFEELEKKEIILTANNILDAEQNLRKRNSFLFFGTSLHIIIPTLRCNMKCVYCQAASEKQDSLGFDMDKDTADKTLEFINQSPSTKKTIEFQGGEPLLNWPIVEYIIKKTSDKKKEGLRTTIVTNLTLMTEERMKFLIDNDVIVCTSLDGPKEVHDQNRPLIGGSSHDLVVRWIKRFNEAYRERGSKNNVNALVTLTKHSLSFPKEIVDEYVLLGMHDIHLRFLNNMGIASKKWPMISYSEEEYLRFWKTSVGYIKELNNKGITIRERMADILIRSLTLPYHPGYLDLRSPCGAVIGQLVYNHNGDIYSCDEARMVGDDIFKLGNVKIAKYSEITTCDKACALVSSSINDAYTCSQCAYKPYCGVCPVVNFAEKGSIVTNISETSRCKIFMEQFDWIVNETFINK